jgi:hypothetical protein
VQNANKLNNKIVRAAECITNVMLANTGNKLNTVLMCVMPLVVPLLRSTGHERYIYIYHLRSHTLYMLFHSRECQFIS